MTEPSAHLARVRTHAAALGLDLSIERFPAGTRTAQQAADAIGCALGAICKSLVFMADQRPVLVLTSGANRVDEAALAALLGAEAVRQATAKECRAATGSPIGGTPPFGYPEPLPVLLDRDLLAYDEVWAAAGLPDAVFALPPGPLVEVTAARVVDVVARPSAEAGGPTPPASR